MQNVAPRHFVASAALPGVGLPSAVLPGPGLPHDRMARLAARQAFVGLKHCFIEAIADLPDARGEWLRQQVRSAEEPVDLWLLRGPVFACLAGSDPARRESRRQLRAGLDSLFLDSGLASCFSGL